MNSVRVIRRHDSGLLNLILERCSYGLVVWTRDSGKDANRLSTRVFVSRRVFVCPEIEWIFTNEIEWIFTKLNLGRM